MAIYCPLFSLFIMRVSRFPSIWPLRYGREIRKCWSQLSTGAYEGKAVFRPFCLVGPIQEKMIPLFDFLGPKLNFFSLTVCSYDQYLRNGSEKFVLLPYTPMVKWDQHCLSLSAVKTATRCTNPWEFRDPHDPYSSTLHIIDFK